MSLKVSITKIISDGQDCEVLFNLPKTGNYTTGVGGDTVDFTSAVIDALFQGIGTTQIPSDLVPISFDVWDMSGNLATLLVVTLGTTQKNNKVQICTGVNTELGSGAYPSPMSLAGIAVFHKNQ